MTLSQREIKSICISGTLDIDKSEVMKKLKKVGFLTVNKMDSSSLLIVGDSPAKFRIIEALQEGSPVMNQQVLKHLINDVDNLEDIDFGPFLVHNFSEQTGKGHDSSEQVNRRSWYNIPYDSNTKFKFVLQSEVQQKSKDVQRTLKKTRTKKPWIIALEGIIGSGKSTFCEKMLKKHLNCWVYGEEDNQRFLELFYSDPARYSFALQWGTLKFKLYQLEMVHKDKHFGRKDMKELYIWDRSIVGHYVFVILNYLLNGLNVQEMDVYESTLGGDYGNLGAIKFIGDIGLFVWFNDEPARCKERADGMIDKSLEKEIPLSYYECLDDIYFAIFGKIIVENVGLVVIKNFDDDMDLEGHENDFKKILEKGRGFVSMSRVDRIDRDFVGDLTLVYRNEEQILESYKMLYCENSCLDKYMEVYIPENIMNVRPESKNVINKHWNRYKIPFYKNEYKRVVIHHLSKRQHVYLYNI